jgi:hypothetical protein
VTLWERLFYKTKKDSVFTNKLATNLQKFWDKTVQNYKTGGKADQVFQSTKPVRVQPEQLN